MTENLVENIPQEKFLIFTVREKSYALPSAIISEVAALEKVFPLPLIPSYALGIINRYSVPYALIDVCFFLMEDAENAPQTTEQQGTAALKKIIVLKEEIDKLALLIDDVLDIADISLEELTKIETGEANFDGPVNASFEWKGSSVFCLEIDELVKRIKQGFQQHGV